MQHGAELIPHPGGTLLAHLRRVSALLDDWGASAALTIAGLCHAVYGTDGFGIALVHSSDRRKVQEVIGEAAEGIVYAYASADRSRVYPEIGRSEGVTLHDRFTGAARLLSDRELRDFMELTAANELDVVMHSGEIAAKHGQQLSDLMTRGSDFLSAAALAAWDEQSSVLTAPLKSGTVIEPSSPRRKPSRDPDPSRTS